MSGWGKFLVTVNLLLLTAVIAVFGYDVWLARMEREQITQQRVGEMIAGVEERLRRYTDEAASARVGAVAAQPLSNEELRETIKASIETALESNAPPEPNAAALQAASSFSIELGARTQALLERLTDQAANLAESRSVAMSPVNKHAGAPPPGGLSDVALMAQVINGINSAPPTAATPVARAAGKAIDEARALKPGERRRLTEVHFSSSSTDLTPGALRKTREAAEALKLLDATKVRVIGFTDTTGSPEQNKKIARERAQNVATMLADLGIPSDRIEVVGRGESGGPEATLDGVDEPLNRCVGIIAVR
ncbi:MAG: OmpA family protein [Gammaproteobacteria bacterium]